MFAGVVNAVFQFIKAQTQMFGYGVDGVRS